MGLGGSKARNKMQLLIDNGHPGVQRLGGVGKRHLLAADLQAAGGRYVVAAENFQQRRFSRAVTAHQRVHLAGKQREINLLQHGDAGELFADLASFKQWLHHRASF